MTKSSALRWRNWPLMIKGLVGIALPLVLLCGALVSLYVLEADTAAAEIEARRTLIVQTEIQSLHASLAEAAAGVRGYVLTGRENFLLRYRAAQQELPALMASLDERLRDVEQRERLQQLAPQVIAMLSDLEAVRSGGRWWPEQQLIEHLVAQKLELDRLRVQIDAMSDRERELIRLTADAAAAARDRTRRLAAAAGIAGACAVLLAVWTYAAAIVARVRRLRDAAVRLSRAEPFDAGPVHADEIGQLAARLAESSALLQRRAEEARLAQQAAERASSAKSEFLSRVSHELRTPLNAVIGFADLLALRPEPEVRAAAASVLAGGRHLQRLIEDLLDLGGIEAGRTRIDVHPLRLREVLDEAVVLMRAPDGAVNLVCDRTITVQADRQRLRQVLVNLIDNALKYGPPEGPVDIEAGGDARHAWVTVADRGPGLSEAQRARLFTPFDRLGAEHGSQPGSGLGLALSRRLMEAMQGRLDAQPGAVGGMCFRVELLRSLDLPRDAAEPPRVAPPAPRSLEPPSKAHPTRRILCVEDHPGNRALLRALLARWPMFDVRMAGSLAEARALANEAPPDLVLLDLHLPDGDGCDLVAPLRALRPGVPVIAITADAQATTRARALSAGIDEVLTKPLDVRQFHTQIERRLA